MKFAIAVFKNNKKFGNRDAEKLRGYIGNKYKEEILFHNHLSEINFNYHSSKIQYKVINGNLAMIGIDEGADLIISHVCNIKSIEIQDEKIPVYVEVTLKMPELKVDDKFYKYRFETLWIALNNENYIKYKNGNFNLNSQICNNIIEIFKMCKIQADKKIEVRGNFSEIVIQKRDTKMLGFSGEFEMNVELPDYIGIGKRKSIGFGTIKKI